MTSTKEPESQYRQANPVWNGFSSITPIPQTIPTADLYFANVCRPYMRRWHLRIGKGRVTRVGANSFICGRDAIVCRRDTQPVIDAILRDDGLRLTYIIDDDLVAAEVDETLPPDYRRLLRRLRNGQHAALAERADTIVVSSQPLAKRYAQQARTIVLDPHWSDPFANQAHFDELDNGGPIRVAYLGSITHRADRAFVLDVLKPLLAQDERIVVTLIARHGKLAHALDGHPRINVLKQLPWPAYRRRLARMRFHLALYPMLDTPFNRSRSLNKLIEHAVVGAVGVYSGGWAFADHVRHGETGFLVENTVDAWLTTARQALADAAMLRRMHGEARATASRLNDPAPQRQFWIDRLGFGE